MFFLVGLLERARLQSSSAPLPQRSGAILILKRRGPRAVWVCVGGPIKGQPLTGVCFVVWADGAQDAIRALG